MNITKIIMIISLLCLSCDKIKYNPTGSIFHDVPQPTPTNVLLSLQGSQDTMVIWGENHFTFSSNRKIYQITVYLNKKEILTISNDSTFILETENFEDGLYELKAKVITSTDGKSLASNLDAEAFQFEHNSYIEIYNRLPDPVKLVSIRSNNGLLRLEWERYNGPDFNRYELIEVIDYGTWQDENIVKEFDHRDSLFWHVPDYIAGIRYYSIALTAKTQTNQGPDTLVSYPKASVNLTLNTENLAKITWPKPIFYNAINYYKVMREVGNPSHSDWETIASLYDNSDTSYVDSNFGFGNIVKYRVQYVPKGKGSFTTASDTISLGIDSWIFSRLHYNENAKLIYLISDELSLINSDNFSVVKVRNGSWNETFSIALDNSKAFIKTDQYRFSELDPLTLNTLESYYLPNFTGYQSLVGAIACNSSGLLYISTMTYSSPTVYSDKYFVINPEESEPLAVIGEGWPNPWPLLTSTYARDGFQLLRWHNSGVHKYENGTLIQKKAIGNSKYFCFNPIRSSYFYSNNNEVKEYDLETNQIINNILTEYTLANIQVVNNNQSIAGYSVGGYFQIYNMQTGNLEKKVKLMIPVETSFYYVNGYLLSTNGYRIRVE